MHADNIHLHVYNKYSCALSIQVESTVEGVYDRDLHEEVPDDLKEGISIQNLLKIYDDVRKLLHISRCTCTSKYLYTFFPSYFFHS